MITYLKIVCPGWIYSPLDNNLNSEGKYPRKVNWDLIWCSNIMLEDLTMDKPRRKNMFVRSSQMHHWQWHIIVDGKKRAAFTVTPRKLYAGSRITAHMGLAVIQLPYHINLERSTTLPNWPQSSKPPDIETREHINPLFGSQVSFSHIIGLDTEVILVGEEPGANSKADLCDLLCYISS